MLEVHVNVKVKPKRTSCLSVSFLSALGSALGHSATTRTAGFFHHSATPMGTAATPPEDEIRVLQIKTMIAAGLPTHTISEYLDCLRFDGTRVTVHMYPNPWAELDAIMVKLQRQRQELHGQLQQLAALTAPPQASDSI